MIFLTVGSQKFPFERLIREMDRLAGEGVLRDEVLAQIGVSKYEPTHMKWRRFLDKEAFDRCIGTCDLLVTHAGEGAIMTGLLKKRKVVAVPRYKRLGEHVSDHQLEIARALAKQNCILDVEDIADLERVLMQIDRFEPAPYVSGRETILKTICAFIG